MQYIVYGVIIWFVILLTLVPFFLFLLSLLYLVYFLIRKFIYKFKNKHFSVKRVRLEIAVFTAVAAGIYIFLQLFLFFNFFNGEGSDIGGPTVVAPDGRHEARVANPGYCGVLCDFNPSITIRERGRWLNHGKSLASFYKVHPSSLKVEWESEKKLKVYSTGNFGSCIDFSKFKTENKWKNITIEYQSCKNNEDEEDDS